MPPSILKLSPFLKIACSIEKVALLLVHFFKLKIFVPYGGRYGPPNRGWYGPASATYESTSRSEPVPLTSSDSVEAAPSTPSGRRTILRSIKPVPKAVPVEQRIQRGREKRIPMELTSSPVKEKLGSESK